MFRFYEIARARGRSLHRGFTLIELLVVVLIIGILAAVALPQYQKTVEKSRAAQAMIVVDAWVKAQQLYKLSNGDFVHNPSAAFRASGISEPAYDKSQWAMYVWFGSGAKTTVAMTREGISPAYSLRAQFVKKSSGNYEVVRFCNGDEKLCKMISAGAVCSESGSSSDTPWCYTTKNWF